MITNPAHPDFTTILTPITASNLLMQLNARINSDIRNFEQSLLYDNPNVAGDERQATDWLIDLFNTRFKAQQVNLVRGEHEPEYFPSSNNQSAPIVFAHGFFASALHELSHWCIAGHQRRQLNDFGYWYAPDGRTAKQQQAFECVEIKPQAIECLFTLACQRPFRVSQDNLLANFDTSTSTFAQDVHYQVTQYLAKPTTLPRDAQTLLRMLLLAYQPKLK